MNGLREQGVGSEEQQVAGPPTAALQRDSATWSHTVGSAVRTMSERVFRDRRDAGRVLAGLLEHYRGRDDVVVLGLPRGGVPVAYEIATALDAPLDVFVVRKLGVPGHEELAMGAIASGGVVVLNEDVVIGLGIGSDVIRRVAEREGRELARREQAYREGRPMPDLAAKIVILVDDGLATGSSIRAGSRRGGGAGRAGLDM